MAFRSEHLWCFSRNICGISIEDFVERCDWSYYAHGSIVAPHRRLLHKGESLCCFQDSASVTYGGMLPSDLTLSALRFILSAKSGQSCRQDCETVDFCNSLHRVTPLQRYSAAANLSSARSDAPWRAYRYDSLACSLSA